jgi:4-hydroxy-tetrahydrodipicolinate synthase
MAGPMFTGSIVALITPFTADGGGIDEKAFQSLVEWQIAEGTDGLVPVGTTGESPTVSHQEHKRIVELCVEAAAGRVPVIAGTGSNCTAEAVELAKHAKAAGADGQLTVTPYYNKPTQEGLYQHFKAIHDAAELPIIIYNIPPRSVIDMSIATMARLAKLPNIVGVKDATMDLARPLATRLSCGEDFSILSGEDATALALMAQSGDGCISVTANIAPRLCADMHDAWNKGDFATARKINELLLPLHDSLFCESNPGPVKYAASLMGLANAKTRLPLAEIAEASKARVQGALETAGLLGKTKAAASG